MIKRGTSLFVSPVDSSARRCRRLSSLQELLISGTYRGERAIRKGNKRMVDGNRGWMAGGQEGDGRLIVYNDSRRAARTGIAIEFRSAILKSSAPPAASSRWLQLLIGGRPTWVRV